MEKTVYLNKELLNIIFYNSLLYCFFAFKSNSYSKYFEITLLSLILFFSILFYLKLKVEKKQILITFFIFSVMSLIYLIRISYYQVNIDIKYFIALIYYTIIFSFVYYLSHNDFASEKFIKRLYNLIFLINIINFMYFLLQLYGIQSLLDQFYASYDLSRGTSMLSVRPNGFFGNSNFTSLFALYSFVVLKENYQKYLTLLILILYIIFVQPMATILLLVIYIGYMYFNKYVVIVLFLFIYVFLFSNTEINIENYYSLYHRYIVLTNLYDYYTENLYSYLIFGGINLNTFLDQNDLTYLDSLIPIIIISNGLLGLIIFTYVYFLSFKKYTNKYSKFIVYTYFLQLLVFPNITSILMFYPILILVWISNIKANS